VTAARSAERRAGHLLNFGRLLQASLLILAGAYLLWNETLWHWDRLIYDGQLRLWSHPAPEDIVVIGIDDASLQSLGRWPWPRRVHAELVERLTQAEANAVVLDIIFAEPDQHDPAGDRLLAEAVQQNGRVVLPVIVDQLQHGEQLIEVLPIPGLATVAHLGHADIDLERDGIVRSVYLKAGLGEPVWSHVALKVLELSGVRSSGLPGERNTELAGAGLYDWVRDHRIMIPFFGPPGHFQRYSYVDVLSEDFDLSLLRNKIVLVGMTTSTGLDDLPTPVSGEVQTMPGVEIIANILASLRQEIVIQPFPRQLHLAGLVLLVLLVLLALPRLSPAQALLLSIAMLATITLVTLLALRFTHVWIPPATALLLTLVIYIWWSWLRLESTVRFLNQELVRLGKEPSVLSYAGLSGINAELQFLREVFQLDGYQLHDGNGVKVAEWGKPVAQHALLAEEQWLTQGDEHWCRFQHDGQYWTLGLHWPAAELAQAQQQRLLRSLARHTDTNELQHRFSPLEIVQARIEQVQAATQRLRSMRRFIDDSLAQMADGVVVTNNLGRVLLANPHAAQYLRYDSVEAMLGCPLTELMARLDVAGTSDWASHLRQVLLTHEPIQLEAGGEDWDLLVQIAPFSEQADIGDGLIVNFSDISALKASERRRLEMLNFMSHDLRSPIITIIALTQLADLSPDGQLPANGIEDIRKAARKTLDLAEDFLQLARAESSDAYEASELDLVFVADSAIEQVIPQADKKGTEISNDYRLDPAWMLGDGALLERMLVNLLTNAIKYSPAEARIEVGLDRQGDELMCWVQDNGSGIAAEDIPKLFDRFQRLDRKEHRQERGAGLGLAFVKTVIDNHNGRVEVSSELNQGTRFSLYFPAHEPGEA